MMADQTLPIRGRQAASTTSENRSQVVTDSQLPPLTYGEVQEQTLPIRSRQARAASFTNGSQPRAQGHQLPDDEFPEQMLPIRGRRAGSTPFANNSQAEMITQRQLRLDDDLQPLPLQDAPQRAATHTKDKITSIREQIQSK
jgi:hypothetical protein